MLGTAVGGLNSVYALRYSKKASLIIRIKHIRFV